MGWKNFGGGGGQQQNNDSQIDNMVVQSSIAFQISSICKEILEVGSAVDSREKAHKQSARLLIVSLICYCGRQVENKVFTEEEIDAFMKMEIPQLMSSLSHWQGLAGMMLARDPPKTNFFSKMFSYWVKVKENKENYVKGLENQKYKIIIIAADKASQKDVDESFEITEEAMEDLKTRKDIVLKPQPSKIKKPVETAPKTQDEAETKEMPKESIESVPEAQNEQEKVV